MTTTNIGRVHVSFVVFVSEFLETPFDLVRKAGPIAVTAFEYLILVENDRVKQTILANVFDERVEVLALEQGEHLRDGMKFVGGLIGSFGSVGFAVLESLPDE